MPLYRGDYDDVLLPFAEGMAMKLMNSKRFHGQRRWERDSIENLMILLEAEVAELKEAVSDGSPIEAILECYDVANLALMVADRLGMPRHPAIPKTVAAAIGAPTCVHGYADRQYCPACMAGALHEPRYADRRPR